MSKILFLANIQYGEAPTGGGVQTRNQFILNWLDNRYDVVFFDTWKKSPLFSLVASLFLTIVYKNRLIIISYGCRGTLVLLKFLRALHMKRSIRFFVPGNDYVDILNRNNKKYWQLIDDIYVQSKSILTELKTIGLTNISYCPNFKIVNYQPACKKPFPHKTLKFVFIGRLLKEKGVQILIDACNLIKGDFIITIYGKENEIYNKAFFDELKNKRIKYKGYIDLNTKEGYDELATNDVLVFPTFYEGEGFSGTLLDAFICGLPIIATDFNVNPEIVEDGVTGIVIPPNNTEALALAMQCMINGEIDLNIMSMHCFEVSNKYNIDTVLGGVFDLSH